MLETMVVVVLPALIAVAAVSDLLTLTIPNRLVYALVAAFMVAAPLSQLDLSQIALHVAAAVLVLAIGILLFIPGWVGGGDAKLAAAVALWFGFEPLLSWFVSFAVFGGALTFAVLRYRGAPLPERFARIGFLRKLHSPREGVPYGLALAAGTLMLLPSTAWFASIG